MLDIKNVKVGEIVGEITYSKVKAINSTNVELIDGSGNILTIGLDYFKNIIKSAEQYEITKEVNQTEMIELLLSHANLPCSVYYQKTNKDKSKTAYNKEKKDKISQIKSAPVGKVEELLSELIDNPILHYILGELRLIKGYHKGQIDERGRLKFIDIEDNYISKLVDPRTLIYFISDNIKYILK